MITFENIIAILAILVNVLGFIFVIRQIQQQTLATRGETYTNLCGLSYEILKMISEHPQLYKYFYENKPLLPNDPDKEKILCCCEMIANYCDNTVLQRENIPDHIWLRWKNFIKQQIEMSEVFKNFLREYRLWYSPEIGEILDETEYLNTGLVPKSRTT